MLHAQNNITSTKNKETQTTWKAIQYFLNYVDNNHDTKIIFRASDVLYKIDSDAVYLVVELGDIITLVIKITTF